MLAVYLGLEGALPFSLSLKGVIRFLGPSLDSPAPLFGHRETFRP